MKKVYNKPNVKITDNFNVQFVSCSGETTIENGSEDEYAIKGGGQDSKRRGSGFYEGYGDMDF